MHWRLPVLLSHFRHCPVLIFVNLRDFILDFDCYIGITITDEAIGLKDDALFVPVKICEPLDEAPAKPDDWRRCHCS